MLERIRVIEVPEGTEVVGPIVKGFTLGQLADYESIVGAAREKGERIRHEMIDMAKDEVEVLKKNTVDRLTDDFNVLRTSSMSRLQKIQNESSSVCLEVSKITINTMLDGLTENEKIEILVKGLIRERQSESAIKISCHPKNVEIVRTVFEEKIKTILFVESLEITKDHSLPEDCIRFLSEENSYRELSMESLKSFFASKINQLKNEIEDRFVELELSSIDESFVQNN
ncbi:MAG: hypothetical protein KJ798_05105 [Gammaproteobacteria bacterium]|uniref:HrpE/YscL family type III secretion apparatus protein n=1 Tax=Limnobacter sp. TaxID=2003368 RepID=UPI001DBC3840|nr:HrpE/YscL family type III secretion apparatus protein [Limnobacter sp.]MBU0784072.1 hypothetical protein [Gammaproteobacteria bacterium]MBU0849810.1 hypothetical protein [Gammaproteobacteria bacterium]MBU1266904.1 hypothetical protein [Gammaproteobacteria bacterium]MBU1779744.1 hypothetical protein [Gammaproteobacteria bacterium]MBU2088872.1 hypothetical protein [Gammaproteobacteria bacterium]